MKGTLSKTEKGWVINGTLPVHPACLKEQTFTGFIWNESVYREGDVVEFNIRNVYVEPDSSIHCNRGDDVPHAMIETEWARIFEGVTGGLKKMLTGNYQEITKYLKDNYYPPQRKPKE